jgi:hypothetical protein
MRTTLTVFALTALTAAAITGARAEEPTEEPTRRQLKIVRMQHGEGGHVLPDIATLEGDRVKIEDAASLLPGESRSYWTDAGREVVLTRGEGKGYTVEVEGKKIEIGGDHEELLAAHGAAGARQIIVRHEAKEGDAATGGTAAETQDVLVMARQALAATEEGGEPPVIIELVDDNGGELTRQVVVIRLAEPSEVP